MFAAQCCGRIPRLIPWMMREYFQYTFFHVKQSGFNCWDSVYSTVSGVSMQHDSNVALYLTVYVCNQTVIYNESDIGLVLISTR